MNKFRRNCSKTALVMCIAMGMIPAVGAKRTNNILEPGPIDPAVIAPAEHLSAAFKMVAAHVKPCVVSVYSEKTIKYTRMEFGFPFGDEFLQQFFGNQFPAPRLQHPGEREFKVPQHGMGSGMIVDRKGHILTNYHVVKDVDEIKVQLVDKRQFAAEIVGVDQQTDVAVIKIMGRLPDNLPVITLGDSSTLEPGTLVMAIGASFGLAQTVTEGIISATGRSDVGIGDYEDFLQTDAPINPGNSGGPLINMRGEVIGMNTAIASNVGQFGGVAFAIPSSMIKLILPRLLKGEKIERGQLGLGIQNVTRDLARQFGLDEPRGALVSQADKDSAASKAGIETGDIIIYYDGHDVRDVTHLRNLVAATAPGTAVKITVIRKSKEKIFTVTIGKQEAFAAAPSEEGRNALAKFGITVQTLTPDLAKELGTGETTAGVAITDVAEGSIAAIAGLQKGDVIKETNRKPVATEGDLVQVLAKTGSSNSVLLLIKRQEASLFVVLQNK